VTDFQARGKGRLGKLWLSTPAPDAALTFTFTRTAHFAQAAHFKLYPYVSGVALARALNALYF